MIDVEGLKRAVRVSGYTMKSFAKSMNISRTALYRKLQSGVLRSDEIELMLQLLHIQDPVPIFFASKVTQQVTCGGNHEGK